MRRAALLAAALAALAAPLAARAGPPVPNARAFLVEGPKGAVLAQEDADVSLPVASLTKLMTVLLALERGHLNRVVTVPPDVTVVESTVDLEPGERLSVRELLEAALIPSSNDAADTLAGFFGGEGVFVSRMNARARALRLEQTAYVSPDGLPSDDVSSARDSTRLARMLMRKRLFRSIVRMRQAVIGPGQTIATRNNLLASFPGVIGVKTGHTDAAGWCEVAAARRNGVTVYATILGSPSESARDADLAKLLSWGLSRYRPTVVADPHRVYARARTGYGRGPIELVAPRRLVRPLRSGRPVVERVVTVDGVALPVERGQRLGTVTVSQSGHVVAISPLVAARTVSPPGLAGRIGWYAGRTFSKLWSWLA